MKQHGSTGKYLAYNLKFIKTKKNKKLVNHEVPPNRFVTFFTSIKDVSLTVMTSIRINLCKHRIHKSKLNIQNCQVENIMKMIFPTEKFKSLVVMLSKSVLESFLCQRGLK